MLPDRVSNPGPLTYESGALSTALGGLLGCMLCTHRPIDCARLYALYTLCASYPGYPRTEELLGKSKPDVLLS